MVSFVPKFSIGDFRPIVNYLICPGDTYDSCLPHLSQIEETCQVITWTMEDVKSEIDKLHPDYHAFLEKLPLKDLLDVYVCVLVFLDGDFVVTSKFPETDISDLAAGEAQSLTFYRTLSVQHIVAARGPERSLEIYNFIEKIVGIKLPTLNPKKEESSGVTVRFV